MSANNYECPKCHNVFPLANKMLHDARCTESKPLPLNASRLVGQNQPKKENKPLQHRPQPKITAKRKPDSHINPLNVKESVMQVPETFTCWLCGETVKESDRDEHMELHEIEEKNTDFKNKIKEDKKKSESEKPQRPEQIQRPPNNQTQKGKPPQKPPQQNQIPPQRQPPQQKQPQRPPQKPQQKIDEIKPKHLKDSNRAQKIMNEINAKRSYIPFDDLDIFDFQKIQDSINKIGNPTDEDIINELPETEIEDVSKLDAERKICIICNVKFKEGDMATMLPCVHLFHSNCVIQWLRAKDFCPICQLKLTKDN